MVTLKTLPLTVPAGLQQKKLDSLQLGFNFAAAMVIVMAAVSTICVSVALSPSTGSGVDDVGFQVFVAILVGGYFIALLLVWLLNPLLERLACAGMLTIDQTGLKLQIDGTEQALDWRAPIEVRHWFVSVPLPASRINPNRSTFAITVYYEVWELTQDTVQITLSRKTRKKKARQLSYSSDLTQELGHIIPQKADLVFEAITHLGNCRFSTPVETGHRALLPWGMGLSKYGHRMVKRWVFGTLIAAFLCVAGGLLLLMNLDNILDGVFPDREEQRPSVAYDCRPRPNDPEGYMISICQYLNENQIDVGAWHTFEIKESWENERDGRAVIIILLDCCGTGDIATIDKETGEVLGYQMGVY